MTVRVTVEDLLACPKCYKEMSFELLGACASVGIEHGKTTSQMLYRYLASFHERGHTREP